MSMTNVKKGMQTISSFVCHVAEVVARTVKAASSWRWITERKHLHT
jgi:hypothetical protein